MNVAKLYLIIATISLGLVGCNLPHDAPPDIPLNLPPDEVESQAIEAHQNNLAQFPANTSTPAHASTQSVLAEDEGVWTIPDRLGVPYELTGKLSPGDEETVRLLLEGLTKGSSPSAGSRRVALKLACEGSGSSDLLWFEELSCGDSSTVYLTAEHNGLSIFLRLPPENQTEVTYTLHISLHLPY